MMKMSWSRKELYGNFILRIKYCCYAHDGLPVGVQRTLSENELPPRNKHSWINCF